MIIRNLAGRSRRQLKLLIDRLDPILALGRRVSPEAREQAGGGFLGAFCQTPIFGYFPINSAGYYSPAILSEAAGRQGFRPLSCTRTAKIYSANSRLLYKSFAML